MDGTYLIYFAAKYGRVNPVDLRVYQLVKAEIGEFDWSKYSERNYESYRKLEFETEAKIRKKYASELEKIRRGRDYSDRSFVTRMSDLGHPDIILVFGGTNDSWAGVPIGDYQYADWDKEDLYEFRPALCRLLDFLVTDYPDARVYYITNTELSEPVAESIDEACRHYGITNIRLHDIDKQWGHPSVQGMKSICEQVGAVVARQE